MSTARAKSIKDFVRYAPVTSRPRIRWPGGKRLAFERSDVGGGDAVSRAGSVA